MEVKAVFDIRWNASQRSQECFEIEAGEYVGVATGRGRFCRN